MKYDKYNTPWRLVASTIFGPPKDGKLFGTMEVDVTDTEKYIWEQRHTGNKITMTSVVVSAVAQTLANDTPEINCFIRSDDKEFRQLLIEKYRDSPRVIYLRELAEQQKTEKKK